MTYESLMIANQTITKIEVKGKEYAEVNQRIRVFRMLYPNGSIETNIESLEKGICVMSAVVKDDFGSVLGVGHAYEKEDSSFINKTSYIENCETSAVGRALGMCGIGIDTSVASADEVLNAIKQQEGMSLISDAQYNTLMKCIPNHNQTGFYQAFEEWVESNNMNDILPELDGHDATRVDVLQSGYLFSAEADLGRYQMICRVIYR